jgi:hypothetical protein
MEYAMKAKKIEKTASIEQLAKFWGAHDLTEFQDELEEVAEPVFVRGTYISVSIPASKARAIERIARAKAYRKTS